MSLEAAGNHSWTEIAEEVGCSRQTVYRVLKPNKAKVNIPGAPSRTPVALQAPVTTTTSGGYASGEMREQEQIPNFDASFSSMDKSRNSKILGIF